MTYEQAHNSIRGRLDVQVVRKPGLAEVPTAWPNAPFAKPEGKVYVRAWILDGESNIASFGAQNRLWRGPGVLECQLFSPTGGGDRGLLQLVDRIVAAFRGVTLQGGLRFGAPYPTTVGRVENEWQVNVTCPFQVDDYA